MALTGATREMQESRTPARESIDFIRAAAVNTAVFFMPLFRKKVIMVSSSYGLNSDFVLVDTRM